MSTNWEFEVCGQCGITLPKGSGYCCCDHITYRPTTVAAWITPEADAAVTVTPASTSFSALGDVATTMYAAGRLAYLRQDLGLNLADFLDLVTDLVAEHVWESRWALAEPTNSEGGAGGR